MALKVLIGCTQHRPFYWEPLSPSTPNPHVLIVGTSGSGKTQLIKTIISQLIQNGIPVLVFDKHGEYRDVALRPDDRVIDFIASPFRVNPLDPYGQTPKAVAFEIREIIAGIFRGLGDIQKSIIYDALLEAYKKKGYDINEAPRPNLSPPTMDDVDSVLAEMASKAPGSSEKRSIKGVRDRLRPLFDFKIFSGDVGLTVDDILSPRATIVDLSTLPVKSDELAASVVVFTTRKLWNQLQRLGPIKEPRLRLAIVMDEAHWYTFKGSPVETLLREGRKFGVSVIMASQLMSDFSEAVIGNTGLKLALRIDNPRDMQVVSLTLKVNRGELPRAKFDALVSVGDSLARTRIIPYFEYSSGIVCSGAVEDETTAPATTKSFTPKIMDRESIETYKMESIETIIRGSVDLVEALDKACKVLDSKLCSAVIDGFAQILLHPTSQSVSYDALPEVEDNLRERYGESDAKKAISIITEIANYMAGINGFPSYREFLEKLRGRKDLYSALRECSCFNNLVNHVESKIRNLSGNDAIVLYLSLRIVKGCIYQYDRKAWYDKVRALLRLASYLATSDIQVERATRLAIRSGVFSRLYWRTTSGYIHECLVSHGLEDAAFQALEASPPIRSLLRSLARDVSKAFSKWEIEVIKRSFNIPAIVRLEGKVPHSSDRISAALELARLGLAPPGIREIIRMLAYNTQSFLNYLESAVRNHLLELGSMDPSIRVKTVDDNCYEVSRIHEEKRAKVKACIELREPHRALWEDQDKDLLIASMVDPREACKKLKPGKLALVVTPRGAVVCGTARDKLLIMLTNSLKKRIEALLEAYKTFWRSIS